MYSSPRRTFCLITLAIAAVFGSGAPPAMAGASPALLCQSAVREALGQCTTAVSQAQLACHTQTGAPCDNDPAVNDALFTLRNSVEASCTDTSLRDAGLGDLKDVSDLTTQLRFACEGEIDSISARTYGGPRATLLDGSNAAVESCLLGASDAAGQLLETQLDLYGACIEADLLDGSCDVGTANSDIAAAKSAATTAVESACPSGALPNTIGVSIADYVERAARQARCMTSLSFGSTDPFDLDCGPGEAPAVPRGVPTPITIDDLDLARCGDGSPYRFWVKLPDEGVRTDRLLVYMQGGGVCTLQGQCEAVAANSPGLFTSADDNFPSQGILGESEDDPYPSHARVFLPYCTQDVFIGGGATQVFSDELTVERWGGRNVRAALNTVRNILWADQRHALSEGYRPDRQRVVFSGNSAGGFGALYNYHYLLDDLRWRRAVSIPGASMALDNGQGTGILLIGALVQSLWDARSVQPSYCQSINCAVGPELAAVTSERMDFDQRILWVSNQVDTVQANTTNFADSPTWSNALRDSYCDNLGTPGVRYFLSAEPASTHGMLSSDSAYLGLSANGVALTDWLVNSTGVVDAVSESALADVEPFDCVVDNVDSDGDGIGDLFDNCVLRANPDQIDADGDGFGNACDTDLNNDCITNALDLGIFRSRFFTSDPLADFNGDGIVGSIDLGLIRFFFFTAPGPSGTATCD